MRVTCITRRIPGDQDDVACSVLLGLRDSGWVVQEVNLLDGPLTPPVRSGNPDDPGPSDRELAASSLIDRFGPDTVIVVGCFRAVSKTALDWLRERCPVTGINQHDPSAYTAAVPLVEGYTHFTTNSATALRWYRQDGLTSVSLLPPATDARFFVPRGQDTGSEFDVLVVGDRADDLRLVGDALRRSLRTCFAGRGWPSNWPRPDGRVPLADSMHASRCIVVLPRHAAGYPEVTRSLFNAAATGRLVLTPRCEQVGKYLEYDTEVLGYEGAFDLVWSIMRHLDRPEGGRAVANAARLRCAAEHTWKSRLEGLLRTTGHSG